MGQSTSLQQLPVTTQRIRPTPGTTGRRNRKGSISVYCEHSHSIYTVDIKPEMTVFELKRMLPSRNCELKIVDELLPNTASLESLGIDNKTLLRMVASDKSIQKSNSTSDSFPEQETPKRIGPKKAVLDKPQKPNHESVLSIAEDTVELNLRAYAVPDLKLEKSYALAYQKPLH